MPRKVFVVDAYEKQKNPKHSCPTCVIRSSGCTCIQNNSSATKAVPSPRLLFQDSGSQTQSPRLVVKITGPRLGANVPSGGST